MTPTLEVLKLRAVVAVLEFQLAEQRMELESLIRQGRQAILEAEFPVWGHSKEWLAKTNKFVV